MNGIPSSDPTVGWGGPNGHVFQKAYVEFFCSPDHFNALLNALGHNKQNNKLNNGRQQQTQTHSLTYHAMTCDGQEVCSNDKGVNAVTWGVFPGREIIQPTVVDPHSFRTWKDEAFNLCTSKFETYGSQF